MDGPWKVAGWVLIAVAVVLAVIGAVMALDAVSQPSPIYQSIRPGPSGLLIAPTEFVRAVIIAVLSGVAFFSGLSCFLLGTLQAIRNRLDDRDRRRDGSSPPSATSVLPGTKRESGT